MSFIKKTIIFELVRIYFKFIYFYFILIKCFSHMYIYVSRVCLVPEEAIREGRIPWNGSWRWMGMHPYMSAKNYTQAICNSNWYSELLSHSSISEFWALKQLCSVLSCLPKKLSLVSGVDERKSLVCEEDYPGILCEC